MTAIFQHIRLLCIHQIHFALITHSQTNTQTLNFSSNCNGFLYAYKKCFIAQHKKCSSFKRWKIIAMLRLCNIWMCFFYNNLSYILHFECEEEYRREREKKNSRVFCPLCAIWYAFNYCSSEKKKVSQPKPLVRIKLRSTASCINSWFSCCVMYAIPYTFVLILARLKLDESEEKEKNAFDSSAHFIIATRLHVFVLNSDGFMISIRITRCSHLTTW